MAVAGADFPLLCDGCLGSSPYVKMQRTPGGGTCKVCARGFEMFKWRPGRGECYKKTEVRVGIWYWNWILSILALLSVMIMYQRLSRRNTIAILRTIQYSAMSSRLISISLQLLSLQLLADNVLSSLPLILRCAELAPKWRTCAKLAFSIFDSVSSLIYHFSCLETTITRINSVYFLSGIDVTVILPIFFLSHYY